MCYKVKNQIITHWLYPLRMSSGVKGSPLIRRSAAASCLIASAADASASISRKSAGVTVNLEFQEKDRIYKQKI